MLMNVDVYARCGADCAAGSFWKVPQERVESASTDTLAV
jgi:hypothetical protein